MISANEAIRISKSSDNNMYKKQMRDIEIYIKAAATKSNRFCYIYFNLQQNVIKELENLGYSVKCTDHRNDIYYTISW